VGGEKSNGWSIDQDKDMEQGMRVTKIHKHLHHGEEKGSVALHSGSGRVRFGSVRQSNKHCIVLYITAISCRGKGRKTDLKKKKKNELKKKLFGIQQLAADTRSTQTCQFP
jgi:hypothetical protein